MTLFMKTTHVFGQRWDADFARRAIKQMMVVMLAVGLLFGIASFLTIRAWSVAWQCRTYAEYAGKLQARIDVLRGDRNPMVMVPPDSVNGWDLPPFLRPLALWLVGYVPPDNGTNSHQKAGQFVECGGFTKYDHAFVKAYNRRKVEILKESPGDRQRAGAPGKSESAAVKGMSDAFDAAMVALRREGIEVDRLACKVTIEKEDACWRLQFRPASISGERLIRVYPNGEVDAQPLP